MACATVCDSERRRDEERESEVSGFGAGVSVCSRLSESDVQNTTVRGKMSAKLLDRAAALDDSWFRAGLVTHAPHPWWPMAAAAAIDDAASDKRKRVA